MGAGLVTIASPPDALATNAAHLTAIMLKPFSGTQALARLFEDRRRNVVLIGPGCGMGVTTRNLVAAVLGAGPAAVLDADALTSFAGARRRLPAPSRRSRRARRAHAARGASSRASSASCPAASSTARARRPSEAEQPSSSRARYRHRRPRRPAAINERPPGSPPPGPRRARRLRHRALGAEHARIRGRVRGRLAARSVRECLRAGPHRRRFAGLLPRVLRRLGTV